MRQSFFITALCILFLTISPAAKGFAQEPPEKKTEILVKLKPWPLYGAVLSPNFIVYYDNRYVSEGYAQRVADSFEYALNYFKSQGYRHPAFSDAYRVSIEIKKDLVEKQSAHGLFAPRPPAITLRNPYFEIDSSLSDEQRTGTCNHELFHFIQLAYDENGQAGRWLHEATAVWSQDAVSPLISKEGSYLYRENSWYRFWSQGFELNRDDVRKPGGAPMPYGSSFFFKYLTEHHPKGNALVKEMWEYVKTSPDALTAVQASLGDISFGFDTFADYFTDFCVAMEAKTKKPYEFRRGDEITANLLPKGGGADWHYSAKSSLNPLSALYFYFWPPDNLIQPANFHLVLKKNPDAEIRVKAIKANLNTGQADVEDAEFSDSAIEKIIPNYGKADYGIGHIIVVVCNPSLQPQSFEIGAVVSEPPYLKEVQVYKDNMGELIYHANWEDNANGRIFKVIKNELKLKEGESRIKGIDILLSFSRGIEHLENVRLGESSAEAAGEPNSERTLWKGRLLSSAIDTYSKKQGYIQLRVLAQAPEELWLDSNPATVPGLDANTFAWNNYESEGGVDLHKGGIDETHKINLNIEKKPDEKPKPAAKEEKSSAVKKFFVDSIFSKADAERISPHLTYFTVAGEKKDGLLSKDTDFTYNTPHSQSASYGMGWWYDHKPKADELVIYDATASITFTHFNPSDPIPLSGLKKNLTELLKANTSITKTDPRGLPFDEAYGMEGENGLYFYGISQNSYLFVHIFHRVHGTVTGVPQNLNELTQRIFERIKQGMDNLVFAE